MNRIEEETTMPNMENLAKGKKFSKTNQPANRGRKPDILKQLKGCGLSENDVKHLLESLILKNQEGANQLLNDESIPILAVSYLRALVTDILAGRVDTVEKILDRIYGKASQRQELEAKVKGKRPVIIFGKEEEDA